VGGAAGRIECARGDLIESRQTILHDGIVVRGVRAAKQVPIVPSVIIHFRILVSLEAHSCRCGLETFGFNPVKDRVDDTAALEC
jgi:hypothetical protein